MLDPRKLLTVIRDLLREIISLEKDPIQNNVSRRGFMERCGWIVAGSALSPRMLRGEVGAPVSSSSELTDDAYGSGHFGNWITDEFGLPAFRYTCNQTVDPKAIALVDSAFRSPTDQTHQVGNDRLVAAVSNYGYVQVRQDEGSPKFLNDYSPERGQFGGGIGYLTDGKAILSTFFPGTGDTFDRVFGMGYLQKKVSGSGYDIDHVIFAPFGDDPVLVSQVTIVNRNKSAKELRWVEYWGCQIYQFSYRSWLQASVEGLPSKAVDLRRKFGDRFSHQFHLLERDHGLIETKHFLGRTVEDEHLWQAVKDIVAGNTGAGGISNAQAVGGVARMEDLDPPGTFLVSLDGPAQGFATDGKAFFGTGGVLRPTGLLRQLDEDLSAHGPESAMLLERSMNLAPGESKTLRFLYGYLPKGADLPSLMHKYQAEGPSLWGRSSDQWKQNGVRFAASSAPWVERELAWSHYYVRSNLTYDDFFNEHILSQGEIYQYIMGLQGAARDPLQHALPFLFSDPKIVREVLRYTLREVRSDGSIPYAIVGHGVPMPTTQDDASDLPLWLIWVACEYMLATRDFAFLNEEVSLQGIPNSSTGKDCVRDLLARCYRYMIDGVGTGPHGLMRMLMDDWLDGLVYQAVPLKWREEYLRVGESVLNSAMASYVFDQYASVLTCVGWEPDLAVDARRKAEHHRQAVRAQWTGRWFRRGWLGPELGWIGSDSLWIGPQSWAIIGGAATPEQSGKLVSSIDEFLRHPSPIGATRWSPGLRSKEKKIPSGAKDRVCPSLNGILIWALTNVDGAMAWDEWKKNSLARHAEVYPDVWYGTWSGPDAYNGVSRRWPGGQDPSAAVMGTGTSDMSSLDYPVMNMHPHAWPLYTAAKVLGLEFTPNGAIVRPSLPMKAYRFASPLFGFEKSSRGYEGWYAPSGGAGDWTIALYLPQQETRNFTRKRVNGSEIALHREPDGAIEIRGESTLGKPLRWSITA